MATRQAMMLKVGRPLRPADELRTFLVEFDKHRKAEIEEGIPKHLPDSIIKTLSKWQNAHHTFLNAILDSATHEGRKLGIQLFKQAKSTKRIDVLFHVVKWLDSLITDIERNFTTPSKADMEESGSVFSWTHTQRLDYNFFRAMRTELVQNVKVYQRFQKPVPENCRGGVEHLGSTTLSYAVTTRQDTRVPTNTSTGQDTTISTAAETPERDTPSEIRKQLSPPVGGVGIPIDQLADEQNGKIEKALAAQVEAWKPTNQAPPAKTPMVRPGILFNDCNEEFATDAGAGRPVVDSTKRVEGVNVAAQAPPIFSLSPSPIQSAFDKDTTHPSSFQLIRGPQSQQAIPSSYTSQNQNHERYPISHIQKQQPEFSTVRDTSHQPQFDLGGVCQDQQQSVFGYANKLDGGGRCFPPHLVAPQNAAHEKEHRTGGDGGLNVGSGGENGGESVINAYCGQITDEEELDEVDMVYAGHLGA